VRANAASQLRDLQRQRALLEHRQTLTGQLDQAAGGRRVRWFAAAAGPARDADRPQADVAAAAEPTAAAQIGVAKAAQYPTFSLTDLWRREESLPTY
jgi:hypothetical protein